MHVMGIGAKFRHSYGTDGLKLAVTSEVLQTPAGAEDDGFANECWPIVLLATPAWT